PPQALLLVLVAGPHAGEIAEIPMAPGESRLIGQSPVCDVRLSDPTVSRRHLRVESRGDALRVTDQGSTNGTRVNGVRVVEAFARTGDVIQFGTTELRVEA